MSNNYIIVGGGAAGIAAAYTILENSADSHVHLFEARGYYGGRAHTDSHTIKGLPFDMGPVYLQDPDNNPWKDVADSLRFEMIDDNTDYKMRIDRGNGFETIDSSADPAVNRISDKITESYEASKSIPNARVMSKPILDTIDKWFGLAVSTYGPFVESAEPWQYLAADRARENQDEGNLFVIQGLGNVVAEYGAGLKIKYQERFTEHLNTPVYGVEYDATGVSVSLTNSGKVFKGDACIVTASVSVLASGGIHFKPELPKTYTEALKALRLGSYKKIAVELASLPDGIDDDINYYLYNSHPEGIWQLFRLSFYPQNVLVAHASGDFAAALDQMPDTEVYTTFKEALSEAWDSQISFRKGKATTNWNHDQYTLGAYSYTAFVGGGPSDTMALNARHTVVTPLGKLYFAGEALDIPAYGTLQGAYFSGVTAATQMLKTA